MPDALTVIAEFLADHYDLAQAGDSDTLLERLSAHGWAVVDSSLMDPDLTFRDLEARFRDGTFDLRAVLGEEGGTPATKFLAAIMLHAALGENGMDEPPNYCSTEFTFKPAGSVEQVRCNLEVIKPGGRSSHEIRQALEAKLRAAGIDPEEA